MWRSGDKINTYTGTAIPNICHGGVFASDWTCDSGNFYIDLVFPIPFKEIPSISSSVSQIGPLSPCMHGAMDAIQTYATDITLTGFRLYGGASPDGNMCTYPSGWGTASVSYIVVGLK